jgi:CrcB protein
MDPALAADERRAVRLRGEVRDLGLVAAGAIPGALLRWRLELLPPDLLRSGPLPATLAANLLGSFLLGFAAAGRTPRPRLMLALGIGFCGSLTTFSGWILGLVRLAGAQGPARALLPLLLSLVGGLLAVAAGALLGRRLSDLRHARRGGVRR